jgi:hypothetical protein
MFCVDNTYLIVLISAFQWHSVAPSHTFDSSLTAFEMSGLECLTKYRSIPTPDLYFDWSSLLIHGSPGLGRMTMVFGPAGVLYSLVVDIKVPKASLRCFNSFGWCMFKKPLFWSSIK